MHSNKEKQSKSGFEQFERGQALTDYLVVLIGLAIVWTGIETILTLVRAHSDNYSSALNLIF